MHGIGGSPTCWNSPVRFRVGDMLAEDSAARPARWADSFEACCPLSLETLERVHTFDSEGRVALNIAPSGELHPRDLVTMATLLASLRQIARRKRADAAVEGQGVPPALANPPGKSAMDGDGTVYRERQSQ